MIKPAPSVTAAPEPIVIFQLFVVEKLPALERRKAWTVELAVSALLAVTSTIWVAFAPCKRAGVLAVTL